MQCSSRSIAMMSVSLIRLNSFDASMTAISALVMSCSCADWIDGKDSSTFNNVNSALTAVLVASRSTSSVDMADDDELQLIVVMRSLLGSLVRLFVELNIVR